MEEFNEVIEDVIIRYPQVELYLKSNMLYQVSDLLKDIHKNGEEEVDIEKFKQAICVVDKETKSLPATAQVRNWLTVFLLRMILCVECVLIRLPLNKAHIFLSALTKWINVKNIRRDLASLGVVDAMNSALLGVLVFFLICIEENFASKMGLLTSSYVTSDIVIWGNLRLLEESKRQLSCPEIGFLWDVARNGFGIQYMQGLCRNL